MASHNIHANPKGVLLKLGLLEESQALLAGPSNAGLADPGDCAALSLTQVSTTLLLLRPTFDNNIGLQIMIQPAFSQLDYRRKLADWPQTISIGVGYRHSERTAFLGPQCAK
jgi:hypothetical protein